MKSPDKIVFDVKVITRKARQEIKRMQAQLGERYYHEGEVNKLIKAFQDKYKDPGCDGLPYEPKPVRIILTGKKV